MRRAAALKELTMSPIIARSRSREAFLRGAAEPGRVPHPQPTDPTPPRTVQPELQIEYRPISALLPYARNARKHSPAQVAKIATSIKRFEFIAAIVVDAQGEIVAGHGRLAAAQNLGLKRVPVVEAKHLSPVEVRAYRLADNRIAEEADWDDDLLSIELKELVELDTSFEITDTGFEIAEIDVRVTDVGKSRKPDPDDAAGEPSGPAITRHGDLWALGPHRLLCGDARDRASFTTLLADQQAQMIFTDPPYNVRIAGHVSGLGAIRHREFVMASGEMTEAEFTEFLKTVFTNLATASADGAIHFVCMDWRHLPEILAAGHSVYSELKNVCCWVKDNGGMSAFYRSRHELVLVFKHGTGTHINNFGLGGSGRYRTNVWEYAGVNSFKRGRSEELAMHPTVKPVALVADAILDCSKRGGIVLDAFGGSGTTLMAAHRTGRRGYLIELDPLYCDVIIRRYQKHVGQPGRLVDGDLSFEEVAAGRISGEEGSHV